AFSPDGRRLASFSFDRTVKIWDPEFDLEALTFRCEREVNSIAFIPDGRDLAVADENQKVSILAVGTGKEVPVLDADMVKMQGLAFSSGMGASNSLHGMQVIDGQKRRIRNLTSGREVRLEGKRRDFLHSYYRFSPNGNYLVEISELAGTIYDATTG